MKIIQTISRLRGQKNSIDIFMYFKEDKHFPIECKKQMNEMRK